MSERVSRLAPEFGAVEWNGGLPPAFTDEEIDELARGEDEAEWSGHDEPAGSAPNVGPQPLPDRRTSRPRLTVIGDVGMKRVRWLPGADNLIALGMMTGLVAPGGTVKGLYGIHTGARLSADGAKTLFVCSEDALEYIVRPRFEAAGCDARLAVALDAETEAGPRNLHFPSDLSLLAEAIDNFGPTLVVIDPIASYIDAGLDMSKNNEMRTILQPLVDLAKGTGIAILVVMHTGKDRGRGALGSFAFEDACRCVVTAAKDDADEDVRHLEVTKSNLGPVGYGRKFRIVGVPLEIEKETVEVAKLIDEGRSDKSVKALLTAAGRPGPDPTKRQAAKQAITAILVEEAGESVNAGELRQQVAEQLGVSQNTVWRAFKELKEDGLAGADPVKDEHGEVVEWRWHAKAALLVGRGDA